MDWYTHYMVLQTSFLTPPFGFSIFYLRGVANDQIKTVDIYKGVVIRSHTTSCYIINFYFPRDSNNFT